MSLEGYSPWDHKDLDMIEWLTHTHTWCIYGVSGWEFLKLFWALSLWRSCLEEHWHLRLSCHHLLVYKATAELVWASFLCLLLLFQARSLQMPASSFKGGWLWVLFHCLITSLFMIHPWSSFQALGLMSSPSGYTNQHPCQKSFCIRTFGSKSSQTPTHMKSSNFMWQI